MDIRTPLVFTSEYGFTSTKTDRLLDLINAVGATTYLTGPGSKSYLDETQFVAARVALQYQVTEDIEKQYCAGDDLPYSVVQFLFNQGTTSGSI